MTRNENQNTGIPSPETLDALRAVRDAAQALLEDCFAISNSGAARFNTIALPQTVNLAVWQLRSALRRLNALTNTNETSQHTESASARLERHGDRP